jgi:flagellar hook-basal body complex protein FliE
MSDMNVNQLLAQMRTMSAEIGVKKPETENNTADFAALLKQSIDTVNATQRNANQMAHAFETGDSDASLGEVMISLQKANVSFQAMVQVRNKLVEAYNDVMNMPM